MVVDDDPVSLDMLVSQLHAAGYDPLIAQDARHAIEILTAADARILISDWLMPNMDGLDLCRAIRSSPHLKYTYVIMVTVEAPKSRLVEAFDAGVDDYLVKPFDQAELLARVRAGCRIVGLQDELRSQAATLAQVNEDLRAAARTDRLTGLPNRALFCDRLQQAILRARRLQNYYFAVLFLDFDRFKLINDSLGHAAGDQVLQAVAARLRKAVRSGDSLSRGAREHTTARLGGDEFVVLLDGIRTPDDARVVADRLLDVLSTPHRLGKHEVYSTASIGIVTSEVVANTPEDILRDADAAMYEAKLAGKGRYVVFDVSMRKRVQHRVDLETHLHKALDANQLFLEYQPIVSLDSGQVVSCEALLRWKHPERGLILPTEFIPIAEDCGFIIPIGEWVLAEACRQCASWGKTHAHVPARAISVNVSPSQLLVPGLPGKVRDILNQTGLPPSSLYLEITESAVMRDVDLATRVLHEIKDLGIKLVLDDFGTGYSSLSCLHRLPLDVLKIDRSFVANIERGRDFAALIHSVAVLARNLGISVVAEGIETIEQLLVLQTLDCEFGQGYLFARPMAAAHAGDFQVPANLLQRALSGAADHGPSAVQV